MRLTIGNSMCKIEGLPVGLHKQLGSLLSYRTGSYRRYFRRSLLTKRGDFPTGLLYLARRFIGDKKLKVVVVDTRIRPEAVKGLFKLDMPFTPRLEQEMAAKACVKYGRGIIVAPTGVGKGAMAALIINFLQVPTLLVVPGVELKRQLIEGLRQCFGSSVVGGDINNPSPITVENVDALSTKLDVSAHFDCVIIDEFHHSGAATYRRLNKNAWKGIYYKFGLTATPFRSQDDERLLLESVLSKVIYRIPYKLAVEKGYIVPLEAYYYEIPKKDVDGVMWAQVYKELVVDRQDRNHLIAHVIRSLLDAGKHHLCLVKEILHGETISKLSSLSFSNGQDEFTRPFIEDLSKGLIVGLIATTGVAGEGVDTKPVEYILVAGLGKSKNQFMQQCGRGFRLWPGKESCKIILFYDKSHKWTRAHFRAQCKVLLDEYGIKPIKLELPEGIV